MKIRLLVSSLVVLFVAVGAFAQVEPISQSAVLSVKPSDGRPVVFSNEADLIKIAPLRIEALKIEIANLNTDSERLVYLKELLWRFENAKVISESDKNTSLNIEGLKKMDNSLYNSKEPADKVPFTVKSEVDLKEYIFMNVERCKKNIENNFADKSKVEYYRELMWRFENVVVTD